MSISVEKNPKPDKTSPPPPTKINPNKQTNRNNLLMSLTIFVSILFYC